jgi:hypothetical protein
MYVGAGILVGLLNFSLSCHKYSNLSEVSTVSEGIFTWQYKLVSGFHFWTGLWRAELCDRAVQKIDVIVKVDHLSKSAYCASLPQKEHTICCKPFIFILPLWQLYNLAQASST